MTAPVLQFKRGALSNLPGLKAGEPAFTTDSFDFYVGVDSTTNNNKFFGSHRYWSKETASKGSGINLVEATGGSDFITLAAPASVGTAVTYTFPAAPTDGYFLKTNSTGTLSWEQVVSDFYIAADSGSSDNVSTGSTITFAGGSNVNTVVTDNTITVNLDNEISISGIGTFSTGLVADGVRLGIGGAGVVDTTSGPLYLDSASGTTIINDHLDVLGDLDVTGNVYIGGTTISLRGEDVFIENKDIVLGYTTSVTPNDITANHAGVAIASTVGSPLVSFVASGINTLPDTYKQLMWFQSGTLGFSTDAFAFNYGLAIGTTTMGNGVRLAVGSGITMSDNTITATTFNGALSGNASSADQVKTITASDTNATYHLTFVDSNNGSATNETVYTDDGIYYNPGTNTFTTQNAAFTGNVNVSGITTLAGNVNLGDSGSDLITVVGVTTFTTSNVYINNQLYVGGIQITGGATFGEDISARHLSLSGIATVTGLIDANGGLDVLGHSELDSLNASGIATVATLKLAGTSGIGITGISTSVTLAENSNDYLPTQAAVKAYVDAVDVTLGLNADTGGPSTVSTAQTLTISGTANEIETSVAGQTITVGLPNTVVVGTALSAPTVKATNVQATDGTTAITISNTTGAVGFANSVTVNGDLYVIGTTTQVETSELKVQDSLIDLGLIQSGGSLVPPTSDLNIDVGMLMNWYSGSAKKAAVYWDDSAGRIGISSDVSESSGVLTANAYAAVEIGALWVTDCAGTSQVISCTGGERFLNNITVDAGTF